MEAADINFQQQDGGENSQSEPPGDLTSFQFVPEKIVDFSITQDGQRSYRVRWKDSWLTEELLALTYQHLINEFWSNAVNKHADASGISEEKAKVSTSSTNPNPVEQVSTQLSASSDSTAASAFGVAQPLPSQQHAMPMATETSGPIANLVAAGIVVARSPGTDSAVVNSVQSVHVREINEDGDPAQLLEHGDILKGDMQSKLAALHARSVVSTMLVGSVPMENYYASIPMPPVEQSNMPKYQRAFHPPPSVVQTPIPQNDATGKAQFPKHVFSQAKYLNKKSAEAVVLASDQNRVQCEICGKSLKTKKMLWAHKVAVHYGGNFPCEICGKRCITGAELKRHMTSHSNERKFVCPYCGLAYKRWSHLYQHLKVHEEEKNYRCDVCHRNFKVQSELKDHCFAEHDTNEIMHCNVCKNKLQTPLAVYNHSMRHTGTRDFVCDICGANFKRKQHLVTHMKTHFNEKRPSLDRGDEVEKYSCQVCADVVFQLKMELKAHCLKEHPLDNGEEVTCRTCEKKLSLSNSIYLHGLRHAGIREFVCDKCSYAFKRKSHLLRHKMDVHPESVKKRKARARKDETMSCHVCRKSFKYRASLESHLSNRHGLRRHSRVDRIKPHECSDCHERFRKESSLAEHRRCKHGDEAAQIDKRPDAEGDNSLQRMDVDGASMVVGDMKTDVMDEQDVRGVEVEVTFAEDVSQEAHERHGVDLSLIPRDEQHLGLIGLANDHLGNGAVLVGRNGTQSISMSSSELPINVSLSQVAHDHRQLSVTTLSEGTGIGHLMTADALGLTGLRLGVSDNLVRLTDSSGEPVVVLLSAVPRASSS